MMHKYRNKKTLAQSTVKATVNHPVAPAIFQSLKDQIILFCPYTVHVRAPTCQKHRNVHLIKL